MPPKKKAPAAAGDVALQLRAAEVIYRAACKQRGISPDAELQRQLQRCAEEGKHLGSIALHGPGASDYALCCILDVLAGYPGVRALHLWRSSVGDQASERLLRAACTPLCCRLRCARSGK